MINCMKDCFQTLMKFLSHSTLPFIRDSSQIEINIILISGKDAIILVDVCKENSVNT